jgi:ribulose-5-phosphate 4-epimerase/fuculose-1-phosphate aldolase
VAEALGDYSVVLLRNHGVLVAEKSVPWTVLAAVTLERAIMMQSIASSLGSLRPIPAEQVAEISEPKYQDGLVAEYWRAWLRELERGERAAGERP